LSMNPAPIVLFVYNRPYHTLQTLKSLKENELANKSRLFIYSDGPKENSGEENRKKIEEVRKMVRAERWCEDVHVIESDVNKGLAKSITEGVSEIVNRFGTIIVLEDDMVTSPYFLKFMNDALETYRDEHDVVSVTGYQFPVKEKMAETFFLKGTYCWGWATWQRAWKLFTSDAAALLKEIEDKNLSFDFDFYGTHHYTQMLRETAERKNDSWALPWYAATFLKNKLTLLPGRSLVQNIGTDASGTHGDTSDIWRVPLTESPVEVKKIAVHEEESDRRIIADFFQSLLPKPPRRGLKTRIKSSIKKFFGF
jgi:hypothetical protein